MLPFFIELRLKWNVYGVSLFDLIILNINIASFIEI